MASADLPLPSPSEGRPVGPSGEPIERRKDVPKPGTATGPALKEAVAAGVGGGLSAAKAIADNGLGGGIAKILGNMTAVAFMFVMFWLMFNKWVEYQKDDRQMWREQNQATTSEIRALTTEVRTSNELMRAALDEIRHKRKE